MDGGFTNNNPADIMKKRGSKRIIMVHVGDAVRILGSILSTLNARILRTNVLLYVYQSQNVTRKAAEKDFRTKNLRV